VSVAKGRSGGGVSFAGSTGLCGCGTMWPGGCGILCLRCGGEGKQDGGED